MPSYFDYRMPNVIQGCLRLVLYNYQFISIVYRRAVLAGRKGLVFEDCSVQQKVTGLIKIHKHD